MDAGKELTTGERAELERHEAIVERGEKTFIEVGRSFAAIRDGRLYRMTSETFEGYCQVRFGYAKRHVYQLIDAVGIVDELASESAQLRTSESEPIPQVENEYQARALKGVPKDELVSVMREAAKGSPKDKKTGKPKVGAKHIQRVVASRIKADLSPASAAPQVVASTKLATDNAEPWAHFNEQIEEAAQLYEQVLGVVHRMSEIAKLDNTMSALLVDAGGQQWEASLKDSVRLTRLKAVARYATKEEVARLSLGARQRNWVYASEVPKAERKRGVA